MHFSRGFSIMKILSFLLVSFASHFIPVGGENQVQDDYDYTTSGSDVKIYKYGINTFNTSDVAYSFFVTVENIGNEPVNVGLVKDKCCQTVRQDDLDCESIRLTNGLHIQLYPGQKRNLTSFYINGYLLDRIGYCEIKVRYHYPNLPGNSFDGGHVKIPFDTTLPSPSIFGEISNLFKTSSSNLYTKCKFVDQDPRKHCGPVNCVFKYSGFRSFYNRSSFQCEPTPRCSELESMKKMGKNFKPTIMLSRVSNKCLKIKPSVHFDQSLLNLRVIEDPLESFTGSPLKVKCDHGVNHSTNGGFINCTCDPGWTSLPVENKTFDPTRDTLTLCNTRNGQRKDVVNMASMKLMLLLVLAVILILLLCIGIPYISRKCMRTPRAKSHRKLNTPGFEETEPIISSIKNRREIRLPPAGPIPTKSEILTHRAEKSKQHVTIQAPCIEQKPKPMFLRFHDDLNCNEANPPEDIFNLENFPVCKMEKTPSSQGSCMTLEPSLHGMGSTCDCCDNSFEPILKINVLPSIDQECCSCTCTHGMDRNIPNIEIRAQGIYLPDSCCHDEGFKPAFECYPARENEYRKQRMELLDMALWSASSRTDSHAATRGSEVPERINESESNRNSSSRLPKNWVSQFWDSNKN